MLSINRAHSPRTLIFGFTFLAALQLHAADLLDLSGGLTGWTTAGTVTSLNSTDAFTIVDTYGTGQGDKNFSLTPPSGENMFKIRPSGSGVVNSGGADAQLGLSNGTLSTLLDRNSTSPTNFGIAQKTFSLAASTTYSFSWAYAGYDYQPYNDGVLFAVTGVGSPIVTSLARNGTGVVGDNSGPSAGTLVLGSYGSTNWITSSFTTGASGNYLVSFVDYNWDDFSLDPVFYIASAPGSFTGVAVNAIPEPSTYAILFGSAVVVFAAIRRRYRAS